MTKDYDYFIDSINKKLGINLKYYKEAQMKRRLTSLRNKRGFHSFTSYFRSLEKNDELLEEFIDRITINVSEFFRNPKRWEVLRKKILPYLTTSKEELSIWSAACSTGEEAYSIALMLEEYFPQIKYKILATDLDQKVLQEARKGIYQEKSLKDLPSLFKKKYFTQENSFYQIDERLKRNITFEQHDLLTDRYPNGMDLIICRNVLIYFTDQAKEIIYKNLSEALNEEGILFVGSTEQIFTPADYNFKIFDTFFYKKIKS